MDLFTIIALPVVGLVILPLIILATRRGLRRPFVHHRDGAHHGVMFSGFYGGDGGGGGCDGGGGGGGCGGGSC